MSISRRHIIAAVVLALAGAGSTVGFLTSRSEPMTTDGIYITTSDKAYVRQAYAAATKRRDLLAQLPCHCGCMARNEPTTTCWTASARITPRRAPSVFEPRSTLIARLRRDARSPR